MNTTHPLQLLVRQAHAVLHAHLIPNTTVLSEDGNALDLNTVLNDASAVVGNGRRGALDTGPGADLAVPAHDGVHDARIVLDFRVLKHNGFLHADTGADDAASADRHVGADLGGGVNLRGGVDVDGGEDVSGGLCELFGAGLEGLGEVEGVGGDGGASGFDLAPEVLGLEDEELPAVGDVGEDILFETDDGVLLVFLLVLAGVVG